MAFGATTLLAVFFGLVLAFLVWAIWLKDWDGDTEGRQGFNHRKNHGRRD